jgi:hypothetical protein
MTQYGLIDDGMNNALWRSNLLVITVVLDIAYFCAAPQRE